MNKLGCWWTPSPKGAGSRVAGISAVHQRLALKDDDKGAASEGRSHEQQLGQILPDIYKF